MSANPPDDQARLDLEGLYDVARLLAEAQAERDAALAAEASAHKAYNDAAAASRRQREAFDAALADFRASPPAGEGELLGALGGLRAARAEALRLELAEADARGEHTAALRRSLKARQRCTGLVDSLDSNPLFDYALANARADVPADATPAAPAAAVPVEEPDPLAEAPPKRGRGRPRKETSPPPLARPLPMPETPP